MSFEAGDYSGDETHPGPGAQIAVKYRFPSMPWLFIGVEGMGDIHGFAYAGNSGDLREFAGYGLLGAMFDAGPLSLGAGFGPGYSLTRIGDTTHPTSLPDSGSGFSMMASLFGWYHLSPSLSVGAELDGCHVQPSNRLRTSVALEAGYHLLRPTSPSEAPVQGVEPVPPAAGPGPKPSWISMGLGAGLDLTTWGDLKGRDTGIPSESKSETKPISATVFVDLTYLQVSAGYMMVDRETGTTSGQTSDSITLKNTLTYIALAAYLKYPFTFGPVAFFPLAGVEYRLNLAFKDPDGNDVSVTSQERDDLNELWVKGGAGMDLSIGSFFIRPEVLVGFKPLSPTDNAIVEMARSSGWTSVTLEYFTVSLDVLFGYKL